MEGWVTGVEMAYLKEFTEASATRLDVGLNPYSLAKLIAGLGKDGWEMAGAGSLTDHYRALYFKHLIEAKPGFPKQVLQCGSIRTLQSLFLATKLAGGG